VLTSIQTTGKINYSFSYGPSSLKPGAPPVSPTTLFTLASFTKLLTSLCLLLLVHQGVLDLDEDVTSYLPTLAEQPILDGFSGGIDTQEIHTDADPGKPIYSRRTVPITLRHLLTHTAGTGYLFMDPRLTRWARATGRPLPVPLRKSPLSGGQSIDSRFNYPLLFEPGTGWVYGSGLDWAGRLIEVLTGGFFDDFLYENVLMRVGVPKGGITFHPGKFSDAAPVDAFADMAERDPATGKVVHYETEVDPDNEGFGGEGLFGGLGEYMKVMHSLLVDDGKVLPPEVTKWLFTPLLKSEEEKQGLKEALKNPDWLPSWVPQGIEYDWSAGGLLSVGGELGHRGKMFLQWAGAWNLTWVSFSSASVNDLM
jgi:CubicO group peptidase (beta-lactamase class C family)